MEHVDKSYGRYIIGLLIVALGVIALFNNFGVTAIGFGYLINLLWPLLLIAAGVNFIANRNLPGGLTGAILIIGGHCRHYQPADRRSRKRR